MKVKRRNLASVVPVVLASSILLSGCNSIRNWMGSDSGSAQSGQPTASEMSDLCDMNRQMTTMSRDAQNSILESHMRSVHGSSSAEGIRAHREAMLQKCPR
jgi:hypothetical protein